MRTRKEILRHLRDLEGENLDIARAAQIIILEVLLDIRKLLIIEINRNIPLMLPLFCEECGEPMTSVPVFEDRKDGPVEFRCLQCDKKEEVKKQ